MIAVHYQSSLFSYVKIKKKFYIMEKVYINALHYMTGASLLGRIHSQMEYKWENV